MPSRRGGPTFRVISSCHQRFKSPEFVNDRGINEAKDRHVDAKRSAASIKAEYWIRTQKQIKNIISPTRTDLVLGEEEAYQEKLLKVHKSKNARRSRECPSR
jgi:hypothetical protein